MHNPCPVVSGFWCLKRSFILLHQFDTEIMIMMMVVMMIITSYREVKEDDSNMLCVFCVGNIQTSVCTRLSVPALNV